MTSDTTPDTTADQATECEVLAPIAIDEKRAWVTEARAALAVGSGPRITFREEEAIHVLPLRSPTSRVGRSPMAEVRLDDATVSRQHAVIEVDGDALRVLDEGSLNGVYVNGERVENAELVDGDEVIIGAVRLYVLIP